MTLADAGCTLQNLREGIRKGRGGDELNVTMTLSIRSPVWRYPLTTMISHSIHNCIPSASLGRSL